jgi:hypothetical protein
MLPDNDPTAYVFTDEEIETFLALESGRKRAVALALETMASNEAMVQKKIRLLDLSTDGPAVAAELRTRAAILREQAALDDMATDPGFEIAEWNLGTASVRDYTERQLGDWWTA